MYRADMRHAQPSHIRAKDMKCFTYAPEKPRAPLRSSDAVYIVFKLFAFKTTKANLSSLSYSIHLFSFFSNRFSHFSFLLFPDGGKKDGKVHFEMGEYVFGGEMAEMEYFFLFRQK
jgi:hypothetical protein